MFIIMQRFVSFSRQCILRTNDVIVIGFLSLKTTAPFVIVM